jgi:hypothetical protein
MRMILVFLVHLSTGVVASADDEPPVCPVERSDSCPPGDLALVAALQDHCFGTFVDPECMIGGLPAWAYCLFVGAQFAETCDDTCVAAEMLSLRTCDALQAYDASEPSCR